MKIKILMCAFFIVIGGHIYAQEKSGKTGGGSSSRGRRSKAISQKHHFRKSAQTNTEGNGTSTHRGRYLHSSKNENQGFTASKSSFRRRKENSGFPESTYKNRRNKKKGVY